MITYHISGVFYLLLALRRVRRVKPACQQPRQELLQPHNDHHDGYYTTQRYQATRDSANGAVDGRHSERILVCDHKSSTTMLRGMNHPESAEGMSGQHTPDRCAVAEVCRIS